MEKKTSGKGSATPGNDRKARLKTALKANLARRKAQTRARSGGGSGGGGGVKVDDTKAETGK
jgi:hypothetical protein